MSKPAYRISILIRKYLPNKSPHKIKIIFQIIAQTHSMCYNDRNKTFLQLFIILRGGTNGKSSYRKYDVLWFSWLL